MCAHFSPDAKRARRINLCGEQLRHPGHICAFFDSRQQQYETIIPFLLDAIRSGDRVINIVDEATRSEHIATLESGHVPVSEAMKNDQLSILTSEETYLLPGMESLDHLLEMLRETLASFEHEEQCLRTLGEMGWVGRTRMPIKRVLEYEARVNALLPTHVCTLMCIYDLSIFPASLMTEILATHPYAIIKGRLRPNPYYVVPEDYLRMLETRTVSEVRSN